MGVTMKKIGLLLIFLILYPFHGLALSWAIPFVVWDGKVYEVKSEALLSKEDIGGYIGKVETLPNDMTGKFYGNASNIYPKGTEFYEIKDELTDTAIAVEISNSEWVKAVYVHEARFHVMNLISSPYMYIFILVFSFFIFIVIKISKQPNNGIKR